MRIISVSIHLFYYADKNMIIIIIKDINYLQSFVFCTHFLFILLYIFILEQQEIKEQEHEFINDINYLHCM